MCDIQYHHWMFARLYVRVHMWTALALPHISLRGEVWAHKTSVTPPLFNKVPVPSHGSEWSCISELGVFILALSTIFLLGFGTVPTVWYFFVFHFIVTTRPIPFLHPIEWEQRTHPRFSDCHIDVWWSLFIVISLSRLTKYSVYLYCTGRDMLFGYRISSSVSAILQLPV
jgi:hypothetical protein